MRAAESPTPHLNEAARFTVRRADPYPWKARSIPTKTSLKASLIVALVGLGGIGLVAGIALAVFAAALQAASGGILTSAESLRLAEEAAIDLLVHARSSDPLVRLEHERRLSAHLVDADRLLSTPAEHAAVREAVDAVGRYLIASRQGAPDTEAALE